MVAHEKIVRDLIKWIDLHIEGRLKIEDVAEKSGYSKWHLQRMFLQVTGETLGCYIRKKSCILHFQNCFLPIIQFIRLR